MNRELEYDMLNIDILLERVKLQGVEYLKCINERSTSNIRSAKTGLITLNEVGLGGDETLNLFNKRFENLIVAATGPRYLGYVIGGTTPASIIGDWLTTIYDQNPQAVNLQGDISAAIERETIYLLLDLFNLPKIFFGGFVTGATMSNFTSLAVARQWIGLELGRDFAKDGVSGEIHILSAMPHSSVMKTLSMLGIGSRNLKSIRVIEGDRESIDIEDLELNIEKLKGEPFILISSAGTVNSADFDNFKAISNLRDRYKFWWHIDGAFGAFAACSPKYSHLIEGWEYADSITIDCHKWLNVPYESAISLINEKHKVLQMETFQNSNAPYLGSSVEDDNYLNLLPENSRRLKALPAWFSLKAYGKKGYQDIVENSVDMANLLGNFIESSKEFELLAPIRFNSVCFTLKGDNSKDRVFSFLSDLNSSGKVYMTPTIFKGVPGIRASFVNWRTAISDIEIVTAEMTKRVTNQENVRVE